MKHFAAALLCLVLTATRAAPEPGHETVLLTKDISDYAGANMVLTVRELEFPTGYLGTAHRHPGPLVVCVLDGTLEIQLEGRPLTRYERGQCFSEDAHQLHRYTHNPSTKARARILSYMLSRKGEPLSQPEK
jgi:quercetin dioxygenase-like cupin family protein